MSEENQENVPLSEVDDNKDEQAIIQMKEEVETGEPDGCTKAIIGISYFFIVITFPISIIFCIKIVKEYERAVIMRMGRMVSGGAQGPGLFFVIPCLDEVSVVDLRTDSRDVEPQEILTKDSVTVMVDAVVFLKVSDPVKSVTKVEYPKYSTMLIAATSLRNILGTKSLHEILREKSTIAQSLKIELDEATDEWGIKVERVELKNVSLPESMQRSMATEAEAGRDARAKVISAEGEQKASIALKAAADNVSSNPVALQLRYLQTLNDIASEKNSTIVFPIPIEMLGQFADKKTRA